MEINIEKWKQHRQEFTEKEKEDLRNTLVGAGLKVWVINEYTLMPQLYLKLVKFLGELKEGVSFP